MRSFLGIIVAIVTAVLIYVMGAFANNIGGMLDPVNGCWANAEPVNKDFSGTFKLPVNAGFTTNGAISNCVK